MKKVALGVGLTITILTGCVSSPQSQEREASNSNLLSVEFVGNSSYKVPQQQGTVRLYALEKRMADAPATLIQEKRFRFRRFRLRLNLLFLRSIVSIFSPL